MTKYVNITQDTPRHWSKWVTPRTRGYKLACCDCGLVHDMEHKVLLKGGEQLDRRKGQIKFRVRRNIKATAAMRRTQQKHAPKQPQGG